MMPRERRMKAKKAKSATPLCAWFVLCTRPATGTTPHPVLGDVRTCDRCHEFATGSKREETAHA